MSNQNNRSGSSDASSNQPAEGHRKQESGGNMGAGRSGKENLGSEKPSERDNMGSQKPERSS
ncbi:MAG TPA: hypothetical protein VF057_03885 [Thermoanaerobaculia bacterium]